MDKKLKVPKKLGNFGQFANIGGGPEFGVKIRKEEILCTSWLLQKTIGITIDVVPQSALIRKVELLQMNQAGPSSFLGTCTPPFPSTPLTSREGRRVIDMDGVRKGGGGGARGGGATAIPRYHNIAI